ncbi:MAG: hypothetical protein WC670_13850 [Pseudolabrys sp.]|jgi:hypothetical protein
MTRVKDHIRFVMWFVGLSYIALWPMIVPGGIVAWLLPADAAAQAQLSCAGFVITPLQGLCRSHQMLQLPPGLHLIGALAAFGVSVRIFWLLLRRLVRALLPRNAQTSLSSVRLRVALKEPLVRSIRRRFYRSPPPRWVPRRDHFGLRGTPR